MASALADVLLRASAGAGPVRDNDPNMLARSLIDAPQIMNPTWPYRLGQAAGDHFRAKPSFDWGAFGGPSGERDDPMRARQVEETVPLALGAAIGGTAFAPRGSLGMAGGKLVQSDMMAVPGAKMPTGYGRFSLEVHRGGGTPSVSHQLREGKPLFAHTDKNIAAEYGKTESFHIDPEGYLDARTPEGAKIWKEINRNEMKAGERGYEGVIYPDPHDWAAPVNGHEVAIIDHSSVLLPGERAWVQAERAAGRDPFGSK